MDVVEFIGLVALMYFVACMGMLYAYCPINDKETSTTHRVVTLLVAGTIIAMLICKASQ